MKTGRMLLCLVVLQALFLIGWASYHEYVRRTAPIVRLKVVPVDPRDLLRGDYMILSYEISRHPAPPGWTSDRDSVWVGLREVDGLHRIEKLSLDAKPPVDGALQWVLADIDPYSRADPSASELQLVYGIEHFFVPEGRGTPRFDRLEVEAAVSPLGRLQLKRVWLDGEIFP